MFWKKRTYQDPKLGTFIYSRGGWSGAIDGPDGGRLSLGLAGDRDCPDSRKLEVMQRLVASASDLRQSALEYLWKREDVREFAEGNGELVFETIDIGCSEDSFDLSFGFTQWPDGYVTVHFTAGKPTDISMGD